MVFILPFQGYRKMCAFLFWKVDEMSNFSYPFLLDTPHPPHITVRSQLLKKKITMQTLGDVLWYRESVKDAFSIVSNATLVWEKTPSF